MKRNKRLICITLMLFASLMLTGCTPKWLFFDPESMLGAKKNDTKDEDGAIYEDEYFTVNKDGEIEMTEEQMYKLLEENGYGEGVDWANQSDDDPSIPKSMDITASREQIKEAYYTSFPNAKEYEPGDMYEKAWWDYIPDSYDLSGDVFPATNSYAGEEKQYNNSLEQQVVYGEYTTGQSHDLSNAQYIGQSFIYEEMKNRYKWTANLDELCNVANSLNIADFYVKTSDRPYFNRDGEIVAPGFMTAHYNLRTVGYDTIGLPQFGGYKFTITVWEPKDEPVGWVNELDGNKFLNKKEIYENMGEWDFYDEVEATSFPRKVVKPKEPNGVLIHEGQTKNLSKEQYIYKKTGLDSGTIYYYGNGITVDMEFYGKEQGGSLEDGLNYCRIICGN